MFLKTEIEISLILAMKDIIITLKRLFIRYFLLTSNPNNRIKSNPNNETRNNRFSSKDRPY